jgi:hypothetical protein
MMNEIQREQGQAMLKSLPLLFVCLITQIKATDPKFLLDFLPELGRLLPV